MDVDIVRIGNSQGVRLPKQLLQKLALQNGRTLLVHIEGSTLVLSPKKPRRTQEFTAVLAEIVASGGVTSIKHPDEWQREQRGADWARDPREQA